jgi:hypothetical protein
MRRFPLDLSTLPLTIIAPRGAPSRHGPPINRGPSVATPSHDVAPPEIFNSFIRHPAVYRVTVAQGDAPSCFRHDNGLEL